LQHDKISVNLAAREGEKIVGYLFALDTGKEAQILNIAVDLPHQKIGESRCGVPSLFSKRGPVSTALWVSWEWVIHKKPKRRQNHESHENNPNHNRIHQYRVCPAFEHPGHRPGQ
jgi:hypothetical protein